MIGTYPGGCILITLAVELKARGENLSLPPGGRLSPGGRISRGIMSDSPLLQLLPIRIVEGGPVLWRSLQAVV